MTISIKGADVSYTIRGKSVKKADDYTVLLWQAAHTAEKMTAKQKIYHRWRLGRQKRKIKFLHNNKNSKDPDVISTLGAMQIPHAKSELNQLSTNGTPQVQYLAHSSAQVWEEIIKITCLGNNPVR